MFLFISEVIFLVSTLLLDCINSLISSCHLFFSEAKFNCFCLRAHTMHFSSPIAIFSSLFDHTFIEARLCFHALLFPLNFNGPSQHTYQIFNLFSNSSIQVPFIFPIYSEICLIASLIFNFLFLNQPLKY